MRILIALLLLMFLTGCEKDVHEVHAPSPSGGLALAR
jgi:hypothetical protein